MPLARLPSWLILLLGYGLLTAVNSGKAFHIDDSFHLEAAQWIAAHPSQPLAGTINWSDSPHSLCESNHPPLYFYLLAAVGSLFGYTELPLHALQSFFAWLALFFFYKISQNLDIGKAQNLLLLLFAACPAFVVNQNIMMDTPLLALSLGAVFFMLKAQDGRAVFYFCWAGFCLGLALMVKYSALPLFVVFALAIVLKRRYIGLFALFIPLAFLFFWTIWSRAQCGESQLFSRSILSMQPLRISQHLLALLVCMGALMPFSLAVLEGIFDRLWLRKLVFIGFSILLLSFVAFACNWISTPLFNLWLHALFFANGLLLLFCLSYRSYLLIKQAKTKNNNYNKYIILLLAFLGLMSFFVLFAPFMASRHVLLLLPFLLLLFPDFLAKASHKTLYLSLFATVFLGLALGISDWQYAHYYRKTAAEFPIPAQTKVWTVGHWGWQWYAQQKGFVFYDARGVQPQVGDYFVFPSGILHRQQINENIRLDTLFKYSEKPDIYSVFSVSHQAQLYRSTSRLLPWCMSGKAIDTLVVCKVNKDF